MKIECVICGKDVENQKTVSCTVANKLYLNLDCLLSEEEQQVQLLFNASKNNIYQRMKVFHFDCFNEVCGEDFKF